MATSDYTTAGIMPAVNDIVAVLAIAGAYVTRFGTVAEGEPPGILLEVTTDLLLPLCGAVWLLVVPMWTLWERSRER
jgi:hypothetical protein